MRHIRVIGVGAGDPGLLTVEAVKALRSVEVFLVLDKGETTAELTAARQAILERYLDTYRIALIADPPRDRTAANYEGAVEAWRDARSMAVEHALRTEVGEKGTAGLLVWGDPALYDGTITMLDTIVARGQVPLKYDVLPGISSVQLLAARHRITLTRTAGAVQITTGRRVAAGHHDEDTDVVVMLDAHLACERFRGQGADLYWGAYLGTADEVLIAGPLDEILPHVTEKRARLREAKGWIMDTYLVRRGGSKPPV
ncbi:precorrin-6A synthase (deacetylating) [Cryptosporangium phraense]|uniref:Precorrin-6A synthase (Deacetylating) n=1 Tax=Cryptosporangium phraense TaxID=2593070 RepID=A0A545AY58_9ACTN|nr:precorrin-6A synthase (deacetylating) [Cryptosporangium phraense]TQS46277.1 precorrin-6A synthase (deacetylating) [Cryptosporangium phraense]